MANTATSSQRLSLPVVMSFASTALPIAAIGLVMAVYLPRFFAAQLGLSLVAVGSAFTIVRLLDGAPIVMAASYMLSASRS